MWSRLTKSGPKNAGAGPKMTAYTGAWRGCACGGVVRTSRVVRENRAARGPRSLRGLDVAVTQAEGLAGSDVVDRGAVIFT